jgi:hypothetical protein
LRARRETRVQTKKSRMLLWTAFDTVALAWVVVHLGRVEIAGISTA